MKVFRFAIDSFLFFRPSFYPVSGPSSTLSFVKSAKDLIFFLFLVAVCSFWSSTLTCSASSM